jgi:protease IV
MSQDMLNAQTLVERRRLRRSRSGWRIMAVVLAVLLVVGAVLSFTGIGERLTPRGEHIARVELAGFINFDDPMLALLERLKDDESVEAVIVRINSPGGVAVAGEALYGALRELGTTKPLVAVIDGMGTSAAYLAASASEHIVARNGSIVGSIGVLVQFPDVSRLLDTVGVTMHEVRSGELKAQPSVFAPPSEAAIGELETLIGDNFSWFVDQVAERRGISEASIRAFEGSVYTGSRAVDLGLVDEVGGQEEALAYLQATHDLSPDLEVVERAPSRPVEFGPLAASLGARIGLANDALEVQLSGEGLKNALRDALQLDGILSVWHGQ